jgi:chemotaxis protein CheD
MNADTDRNQRPHMSRPFKDIFLLPGALAFGGPDLRLRTLLGSCVSVVVWHPKLRLGGMCHFLLPHRGRPNGNGEPDGRYADDALEMLRAQMARYAAHLSDFQAFVCGGAVCLDTSSTHRAEVQGFDIGKRNIAAAQNWLQLHRVGVMQQNVGGESFRHVGFDMWTGQLRVRSGSETDYTKQSYQT